MSTSNCCLNIAIQSGCCFELSSETLIEYFREHGNVNLVKVDYNIENGQGTIEFRSSEVADQFCYMSIYVGNCTVFLWKSLSLVGDIPEQGLLLVGQYWNKMHLFIATLFVF